MALEHVILRAPGGPTPVRRGSRTIEFLGATAAATEPDQLSIDTDELSARAAARLAREADVVAVAPVMPMKLIEPTAVTDATAVAGPTWGVTAVGATTSNFTGQGITVAVLDTGIDPAHEAFTGVDLVQKNYTDEGDDDAHGHGTHCAGTIFGRDVSGTRIGVAPGVERALIGKVLGSGGGGSDKIVEAIQWAVGEGAHVISMSLGIDFPGFVKRLESFGWPTELATSTALEGYRTNVALFGRLASFLEARGDFGQPTLLVAAAGNESRRDEDPDFEIAVSPPAVADGVVSVAALGDDQSGFSVAPFSNTGVRVSGPGVDVVSARLGGGLASMNGTSMATPHVAGVAALWAQKLSDEGSLRFDLLADRLVGTASLDGLAPDFDPADVGAGMVRAPQA